jgi:hypothetical protein
MSYHAKEFDEEKYNSLATRNLRIALFMTKTFHSNVKSFTLDFVKEVNIFLH